MATFFSSVVVSNPYLVASLGVNDTKGISLNTWNSSKPSNFFTTLIDSSAGATFDLGGDIEGASLEDQTYAEEKSGCK